MEIQSVLPPPPRYPITQTTTSPNGQTNGQTVLEMSNVLTHPIGPEFQLSVGEGQNPLWPLYPIPKARSYTIPQAHTSSKIICTLQHPHPIPKTPPSLTPIPSLQHLHRQRQASNSQSASQALENLRRSFIESTHLRAPDRIWERTVSKRAKRSQGVRTKRIAMVRLHSCRPVILQAGHLYLVRIIFS